MFYQLFHGVFIGSQGLEGGEFIIAHEAAVTPNIGTEDSSELPFNVFCGHGIAPFRG
jgi:hypothetical protein